MLVINDKNMLMAPLSIQVGMIEREILVVVLEYLRILLRPEPQCR
jgi:hypothetical protein